MFDAATWIAVFATFFFAGAVKGVIGLGLPTVSLGVLTVVIGLPQAMALLLVPSFVTNAWQAAAGGNGRAILRRLWAFLLMAAATVWVGAGALVRLDAALLSVLLGLLLIAYAAINLAGFRIRVPAAHEAWLGPAFGTANGILTGMTGSFVVPGVMFLQAIGLPRDMLIQAMGILFTISTVALAIALGGHGLLSGALGIASALAVVPAIGGMLAGRSIRRRLSERHFRSIFFAGLLALGAYIAMAAI